MSETELNRVVALWLPDWPVQAAHLASATSQADPLSPVAIVGESGVTACSPSARRAGVRRGQSRRHAEALCPELEVVEESAMRDAAEFEPVLQRLETVAAGVEALRPGLAVVAARGVMRYYGGQDVALEKLLDAAAVPGVDCSVGLADDIVTAILAARRGVLVAPGEDEGKRFRQGVSLVELRAESALEMPAELAKSWQELGLRTLGDVAALSKRDISNRFGAQGARWHDVACRGEVRLVAPRVLPPGLAVSYQSWESPLRRVDEASFVARFLAGQLHEKLFSHGYSCYRLAVVAQFSDGSEVRRVWRCTEPLAEQTTADRVRWQLDGWLNNRNRQQSQADGGSGIVELRLEPMDVVAAGTVKQDLWHGSDDALARARRAAERVQGLLGSEAVQQPVMQGGRGPGERVGFVAFGERPRNTKTVGADQLWPGAIPTPNPTVTPATANAEVEVLDASGQSVGVTGRATMTAEPVLVRHGVTTYRVSSWAGPWPIDERWWVPDEARRAARMQVCAVANDGIIAAWLLVGHAGAWRIEGAYA